MKIEKILKKIEQIVISEDIMVKKYGTNNHVVDGNYKLVDAIFTTSQEMDIKDYIVDGYNIEEIISMIKQW